jgi:hypothetical protein
MRTTATVDGTSGRWAVPLGSPCRLAGIPCLCLLALAAAARPAAPPVRPDLLVADFEGERYGARKTTGTAFGPGPARGALPGQMPVTGFLGKGLVNPGFPR